MTRRRPATRPEEGGWLLSHKVRIWEIRVKESRPSAKSPGKKPRKSYIVRWTVATKEHQSTYATRALADAERAKLIGFQKRGVAFEVHSGLPEPLLRQADRRSWYDHMCQYIDNKWERIAPTSRKSVADTLATVTPALVKQSRGAPSRDEIRELVWRWLAVKPARAAGSPPEHLAQVAVWLASQTVDLAALEERTTGAVLTTKALDQIAHRLDGKPAAPNTIARRKAVLYNVLEYGVEQGLLTSNPIDYLSWTAPAAVETVDRRSVVNMAQGRKLLAAVAEQGAVGARLKAFFAVMLYAALRPAEAIGLRESSLLSLPESGWGELLLHRSTPRSGRLWTESGASREDRGLKHRAAKDTRLVPAHPELVAILNHHVEVFGMGRGDRVFTGPLNGLMDENLFLPIWHRARSVALTPAEVESPLARRPYDLRHTAVSTWLNAGVPPTQVAEWAGHSVAVLLKVYAKCIVGQDKPSRDRIEQALKDADLGKGD